MSLRRKEVIPPFSINEQVLALWPPDGFWYPGKVVGKPGARGKVPVLFEDGYEKSLFTHQIRRLPASHMHEDILESAEDGGFNEEGVCTAYVAAIEQGSSNVQEPAEDPGSNEEGVGGTPTHMRQAQYHLAKLSNMNGISASTFENLATHMSHSESTAKKYYAITRPTSSSVAASRLIAKNVGEDLRERETPAMNVVTGEHVDMSLASTGEESVGSVGSESPIASDHDSPLQCELSKEKCGLLKRKKNLHGFCGLTKQQQQTDSDSESENGKQKSGLFKRKKYPPGSFVMMKRRPKRAEDSDDSDFIPPTDYDSDNHVIVPRTKGKRLLWEVEDEQMLMDRFRGSMRRGVLSVADLRGAPDVLNKLLAKGFTEKKIMDKMQALKTRVA